MDEYQKARLEELQMVISESEWNWTKNTQIDPLGWDLYKIGTYTISIDWEYHEFVLHRYTRLASYPFGNLSPLQLARSIDVILEESNEFD